MKDADDLLIAVLAEKDEAALLRDTSGCSVFDVAGRVDLAKASPGPYVRV
jgi:hypothetical protein